MESYISVLLAEILYTADTNLLHNPMNVRCRSVIKDFCLLSSMSQLRFKDFCVSQVKKGISPLLQVTYFI